MSQQALPEWAPGPADPSPPKKKRGKWLWVLGGGLAALVLFAACVGSAANQASDEPAATPRAAAPSSAAPRATTTPEPTPPPAVAQPPVPPAPAEPEATQAQANALRSARSYLDYTSFSYTGLIKQLEFEGYSAEDATWAVDRVGADWNEQAAKKAQEYLDFSSFSRSGLVNQLTFEGFTAEEAEYGVSQTGL